MVHGQSKSLATIFSHGVTRRFPFGLMRVYSPSAEVQRHGPGQKVWHSDKCDVDLSAREPVGNCAMQPAVSDGHNPWTFSRGYLQCLALRQEPLWAQYTNRLQAAGVGRDVAMPLAAGRGCASD